MTVVKREVAITKYHRMDVTDQSDLYRIEKQMPVMTSALIRKLYLMKHGDKVINQDTPQFQTIDVSDDLCLVL